MSRVGLKPVPLPAGVTAAAQGATVKIKGPKGELALTLAGGIEAAVANNEIVVKNTVGASHSPKHGTMRALVANMVTGVTKGYEKELEIEGVGYKAAIQGAKLVLNVGFSHPIEFPIPKGLKIEVADGVRMKISGIDKHLVGDAAAQIRGFQKAEPYKGKGIKYKGEQIRRKAGKTVA